MNVIFTDKYAENQNQGINFKVLIDNVEKNCTVTKEALQDINPSSRMDTSEEQYLSHKVTIHAIAEQKILNGEMNIVIASSDVC